MPKVSTIQSNFNGGEISPLLYGRVDVPRYKDSLAICENFIPLIQGPLTRRPGTSFVQRCRYANTKSRLIPFEYSTTDTFALEFSGSGYIRFFKNNAPIVRSLANYGGVYTITAATNANPVQITATGPT